MFMYNGHSKGVLLRKKLRFLFYFYHFVPAVAFVSELFDRLFVDGICSEKFASGFVLSR